MRLRAASFGRDALGGLSGSSASGQAASSGIPASRSTMEKRSLLGRAGVTRRPLTSACHLAACIVPAVVPSKVTRTAPCSVGSCWHRSLGKPWPRCRGARAATTRGALPSGIAMTARSSAGQVMWTSSWSAGTLLRHGRALPAERGRRSRAWCA